MKIKKIKKNFQFRIVYRFGKSFSDNLLVMYLKRNGKKDSKMGISVSKKVGKSVIRNRVRRLIYENYRLNYNMRFIGYDIIFIARSNINGKSFDDINSSMNYLFNKAGVYFKNNENSSH